MLMGPGPATTDGALPKEWQTGKIRMEVGEGPCVSHPFRAEGAPDVSLSAEERYTKELVLGRSRIDAGDTEIIMVCCGTGVGRYRLRCAGLPGIGQSLAAVARGVGLWDTWAVSLGLALDALGPRRSAALVWRLAGAYLVEPALEWEEGVYWVLAGWLPGLFAMNGGKLELVPGAWRVVEWAVVSRGWLPDAPIGEGPPGVLHVRLSDSQRAIMADLGSAVGHRRWVSLGSHGYGPETAKLVDGVVAGASLRGVHLQDVLCVTENSPVTAASVLLGSGVLGVLVSGDVGEKKLEGWRSWLFPYAAFVAYEGVRVDARYGGRAVPYPLVTYGVVQQYPSPSLLSASRRCLVFGSSDFLLGLKKEGVGVFARDWGGAPGGAPGGAGGCVLMELEEGASLLQGEPVWLGGVLGVLREVGVVLLAGQCVGWRLALRGLYKVGGRGIEVRHSL